MSTNLLFDYQTFLRFAPHKPGVYRMYDTEQTIIYVGKAKDLKNRLTSYFQKNVSNIKVKVLVKQIQNIEITVTNNEAEALLLEQNYIKKYKPKYNVLLRDDKSYPYIVLTADKYPRLIAYRGNKKIKGEYFGPYPSMSDVKTTLALIQKIFPIQQGLHKVYRKANRPYLQYQIGYCLDPELSDTVTDEFYMEQVNYVRLFLQGKDQQVLQYLITKMEQASAELKFELAAKTRDQIQIVRNVMEKQLVYQDNQHNIDVIAISYKLGLACIQLLFIRNGKIFGNRSYFPQIPENTSLSELTETFIGQFYLQANKIRSIPNIIILNQPLAEKELLASSISQQTNTKIQIKTNVIGVYARYIKLAEANAEQQLDLYIKRNLKIKLQFKLLADFLQLKQIKRMECFDISHTLGKQTVASCVVFTEEGPARQEYRIFNIENITAGDDYAAMQQVLTKRYQKELTSDKIPDLIFIDGGKGQLNRAIQVFNNLQVAWDKNKVKLIGVAKGVDRKAGLETLYIDNINNPYLLAETSTILHLIQYIRDESHNHAIKNHRKKRQQQFKQGDLQNIPGIGEKRKQLLLHFFAGLQGIKNASVEELAEVPNISRKLAQQIFTYFHNN